MLANATEEYAAKLETISPPETDLAFWKYVIDQEHAQATAFHHARNNDFQAARHTGRPWAALTTPRLTIKRIRHVPSDQSDPSRLLEEP